MKFKEMLIKSMRDAMIDPTEAEWMAENFGDVIAYVEGLEQRVDQLEAEKAKGYRV